MSRFPARVIVFSHANGFPAGVYRVLFDAWRAAGFTVHAVERFGHDASYPVTSNWPHLRNQLLDHIEREVGEPAVLVGHSLGGFMSLLAASRRPEIACGVVLLDAPLIAGWRAHSLHMAKVTGLARRITPGRIARTRRHTWPTCEAVREHFARKAVFARWDPRVLDDYVASAFGPEGDHWRLNFERETEARIYETLPHHLGALLRRHPLRCPVAYIGGERSAEARQAGLAATRHLVGKRFSLQAGTHLFPMEQPEATAVAVLAAIESMAAR